METKKPEKSAKDSVRALRIAPGGRAVPPLTDAEIIALRELLETAQKIAEGCPIAQRILSKR